MMFTDARSRTVMLVAHCLLNQNAKIDRCAHQPGMVREIVAALLDAGVGVVQMPCPELLALGLDRQVDPIQPGTIASEDTRVAQRMAEPPIAAMCQSLAAGLVSQVREYQKHGFIVLGVLGVNGSPTCGVETGWAADHEPPEPGVFMRCLQMELSQQGLSLPMRGVKVYQPAEMVAAVQALVEGGK